MFEGTHAQHSPQSPPPFPFSFVFSPHVCTIISTSVSACWSFCIALQNLPSVPSPGSILLAAMRTNLLCPFLELIHVRLSEISHFRQLVFAREFYICSRVASSSVYWAVTISFCLATSLTSCWLCTSAFSFFTGTYSHVICNRPTFLVFSLNVSRCRDVG